MLNLILETEGSENFTATNTHFKGFLNGFQFNLTLNQSEKTFNLLEDKGYYFIVRLLFYRIKIHYFSLLYL